MSIGRRHFVFARMGGTIVLAAGQGATVSLRSDCSLRGDSCRSLFQRVETDYSRIGDAKFCLGFWIALERRPQPYTR